MKPHTVRTTLVEQIRAEFDEIRHERQDIGAWRIIAGWLFEPQSPFDPDSRPRPRPEILIIVSYLGLMVGVFALFNWS